MKNNISPLNITNSMTKWDPKREPILSYLGSCFGVPSIYFKGLNWAPSRFYEDTGNARTAGSHGIVRQFSLMLCTLLFQSVEIWQRVAKKEYDRTL